MFEILIVLAIIGLTASLSAPNLINSMKRLQARQAEKHLALNMVNLRLRAITEQKRIRFLPKAQAEAQAKQKTTLNIYSAIPIEPPITQIELENHWFVEAVEEIYITSDGFCSGGQVNLISPGDEKWTLRLSRLECQPEPE